MKRNIRILSLILLSITLTFCSSTDDTEPTDDEVVVQEPDGADGTNDPINFTKTVPAGPNSYVVGDLNKDMAIVSVSGIHNWVETSDVIKAFIGVPVSGELQLGITAKSPNGASKIKVTVGDKSEEVTLSPTEYGTVEIGKFQVTAGYVEIEIQGLEKSGDFIGDINDFLLGGPSVNGDIISVPPSNQYFGRRGPSANISYAMPQGKDVRWFYNEVTVPEGSDVIGSYFMANGFAEGYFGIQVNSESERRVLFSLWSPFETDDPNSIPEEDRITSFGSGSGVVVTEFGNEGSGGQSFLRYNWVAGTTYRFLLKGEPGDNNSTNYTAYFYAPEEGDWKLIAGFNRPKTTTYLKRLYSFLENFNPGTGYITREAEYGNQWVYSTDNVWNEITGATFGEDATAAANERTDLTGGNRGNSFFMRNCGFFDERTTVGTSFSRTGNGNAPNIDFDALEVPMVPEPASTLDKTGWEVISFSSEETSGEGEVNGRASRILDNDTETYWHSCWTCTPDTVFPHELVIDMKESKSMNGIVFSQRKSLSRSVASLEILISSDNMNWESLGDYALTNDTSAQEIGFNEEATGQYIRIVTKSAHDGMRFAALAEVSPYIN